MNFNKIKTKFYLLLNYVLLFSFLFSLTVTPTSVEANWRTKYEQQKQEINSQLDRVRSELDTTKQKMADLRSIKSSLKEQIAQVESEIKNLEQLMTEIELSIDQINSQIMIKEEELVDLENQMRQLLREIQIQQKISPIELVLTSQSLGEAISRVYNLSALQVRVSEIKQEVEITKNELEKNKVKLEESKKALEESKALVASKKSGLELLLIQTEGEESKYQQWLRALQDQERQLKVREAEIQKEMEAEEIRNTPPPTTSGTPPANPPAPGNCWFEDGGNISANLIKPAQGSITGTFGCPPSLYLAGLPHDGIDIANSIGTPIYAVATGVIEQKGFEPGGYGHFVMIRHNINGERFYSLYAHLSEPSNRSVGEVVSQGDVIGSMGNTGWVTGPHLHFSLLSSTYETTGSIGCAWGSSKCYNPARFIRF